MICKAANTWLDSGKELYVDELSRVKPQEASKLETVTDGYPVPETDSTSISRENLRSSVYTLMRDVAKAPFASPPKPRRLSSNFEASCGLTRESSSTYISFPESNHVLAALQIIYQVVTRET
jgi:hypothetical protein